MELLGAGRGWDFKFWKCLGGKSDCKIQEFRVQTGINSQIIPVTPSGDAPGAFPSFPRASRGWNCHHKSQEALPDAPGFVGHSWIFGIFPFLRCSGSGNLGYLGFSGERELELNPWNLGMENPAGMGLELPLDPLNPGF